VVWVDYRSGSPEVWGRMVDLTTGLPMGSDIHIGGTDTYDPAVAYGANVDLYVVTFSHSSGSDIDIMSRRVWGDGTLKGASFCVSCQPTQVESQSDVAYSSSRQLFFVVWADEASSAYDVYGQRFRPNGNLVGPVATVANGATGSSTSPAAVHNNAKGQFQVVWTDGRADLNIYGQRIRDNGNLIGSSFAITVDVTSQWDADITFDAFDAEYYVVWSDDRRKSTDIYGQLLSSYGRLRGGQRRIGLGMGNDYHPTVSANAAGDANNRYLVAWEDRRFGADYNIHGRFVDFGGQPQGPADFVIENPTSVQGMPAMPDFNDWMPSRWFIVWTDDRGPSQDIWGMLFP